MKNEVDEGILIEFQHFEDFKAVAQERGIQFQYCYSDEGILVLNSIEEAEDLLWAIQVLDEVGAGIQTYEPALVSEGQ